MARGSITKRGDRYVIRYRDDTGKQRWETVGTNKHDAEKRLRQVLGALDTETYTSEKISFSDLARRLRQNTPHSLSPFKVPREEFPAMLCFRCFAPEQILP